MSTKRKIHVIIGTKAQLIKMAPLMLVFKKRGVDYHFTWTGQHKETIREIIDNFGIESPDTKLYSGEEIKTPIRGIIWFTGLFLRALFRKKGNNREIVLVHGDAVSAIIGMMYGRAMDCRIGHVEAGLRSFNLWRPFPEEIVRRIVSCFSDCHFAPGDWATGNLKKKKGVIVNTGMNTLVDALMFAAKLPISFQFKKPYIVVNMHRFENVQVKNQLNFLLDIVIRISKKFRTIFILHPTTEYQLQKFDLLTKLKKSPVEILPRQDYITFISLVTHSEFLITDGGSNQEETSYLGHPCLLLRKETERIEGLGDNVLLSSFDQKKIDAFVANYKKFRKKRVIPKISPCGIIADFLAQEGYN